MKVLINTPELSKGGGVATYYRTLQPYLNDVADYFTAGSRGFGRNHFTSPIRLFKDYWRFARKLFTNHYDVVHLNPSLGRKAVIRDGLFILIAKGFGRKIIIFFHGWNLDYERELRKRWLWLFRWVYFQADIFIVLSKKFRDKLIDIGCNTPIFCETTAVADTVFSQAEIRLKRQYIASAEFNILFLSRVEKAKGIYEALDTYAILKRKHPEVTFTVAGYGSELDSARIYAANHGISDVIFTGYLQGEHKREAFCSADCYFLPSYGEGMPISVLESMAYGLPVITRSVGGLADFFENGQMGFITESLDATVFVELLERLISSPERCKAISRYNREYASRKSRASEVAKRLTKIYQGLIYL